VRCEEFRVAVGAEPMAMHADIAAHAGTCAECADYRRRRQALDRVILAALHTQADQPPLSTSSPSRTVRPVWSVAASLVLSVAIGAVIWMSSTRSSFAADVIAHAQQEPASLVHTLDVVPDAELAALLEREGLRLRPGVIRVSYAQPCRFHGAFAPHLVVQTDHGPVTVLVLPHERTRTTIERIHAAGFDGVIVPATRGVLVAVGRGAAVELVAQTALNALQYSRS
jgi:uncharacterized protein DUF3379